MTVFIDPPLWPAHGRLFSHLVSDRDLAELHEVAALAGLPERAFDGDHYDVPEERHADCVAAGAVPIGATELARVMRDSGLRVRKRKGERSLARVENGLAAATSAPHTLDVIASPFEQATAGASVVLVRAEDRLAMVRNASRPGWMPPGGKRDPGESVREGAVRELAEETGLVLEPAGLTPVGYERITVPEGVDPRPFDTGVNHLQVFAAVLELSGSAPPPLRPSFEDVLEARWFTRDAAERHGAAQPWWALVAWWWERH
ncbi:DUF4031 domain-containing protein [Ornithinimicrobium panacihumi]|uniref:DUF4031 domain-containing protein n=1 Tax=Ornithinimicrobium panacihumi TaxID=2008449 RepID=UPI003F88D307